jgi:hypothetical protein
VTSQNRDNGLSPDNRHHECRHVIDNAEAFALGALDHADRSSIEQHLIWCGPCRRAVADARRATDLLPFLATPAAPSSAVKTRLFDRIDGDQDSPSPSLARMNPWVPETGRTGEQTGTGRPASSWQRWLPPAVLAPLALVLLVTAAWANSLRNEVDYLESERDQQVALAGAVGGQSDMQLYSFEPACPTCNDANGRFGGNPNGSVGVVVAWNLDPSEQHQVWCVDDQGEKWMVTNLDVEPSGNVFQTVSFPQPLGGYQQIYVARNDGTADPDAELMVAMDEKSPDEEPTSGTPVPTGTWGDP